MTILFDNPEIQSNGSISEVITKFSVHPNKVIEEIGCYDKSGQYKNETPSQVIIPWQGVSLIL